MWLNNSLKLKIEQFLTTNPNKQKLKNINIKLLSNVVQLNGERGEREQQLNWSGGCGNWVSWQSVWSVQLVAMFRVSLVKRVIMSLVQVTEFSGFAEGDHRYCEPVLTRQLRTLLPSPPTHSARVKTRSRGNFYTRGRFLPTLLSSFYYLLKRASI